MKLSLIVQLANEANSFNRMAHQLHEDPELRDVSDNLLDYVTREFETEYKITDTKTAIQIMGRDRMKAYIKKEIEKLEAGESASV